MKSISYCITVCNEHEELDRLLTQLDKHLRPEDEILVQMDTDNYTKEVLAVCNKFNMGQTKYEYHRIWFPLNNNFAEFKNNVKKFATRDYYFLIDADEYLSDALLEHLPTILEDNPDFDIFALPRINTVEGLTQAHIDAWRWQVNEQGWVNYPDHQTRVCRNDKDVWWEGKVHERLTGVNKKLVALPPGFDLIHPKDIKRQEHQNGYYNQI